MFGCIIDSKITTSTQIHADLVVAMPKNEQFANYHQMTFGGNNVGFRLNKGSNKIQFYSKDLVDEKTRRTKTRVVSYLALFRLIDCDVFLNENMSQ